MKNSPALSLSQCLCMSMYNVLKESEMQNLKLRPNLGPKGSVPNQNSSFSIFTHSVFHKNCSVLTENCSVQTVIMHSFPNQNDCFQTILFVHHSRGIVVCFWVCMQVYEKLLRLVEARYNKYFLTKSCFTLQGSHGRTMENLQNFPERHI